jgi:hypothetical protein
MIEVAAGQRHTVLEIEEVRSSRRSLEPLHGEHYDWARGADRAGDASHRRPLRHVGQTYGPRVSRADTSHTVGNRSPLHM